MQLTEDLKTDMAKVAERMKKLDSISQIVIASKIDALYERQMIDEEINCVKGPPEKTA